MQDNYKLWIGYTSHLLNINKQTNKHKENRTLQLKMLNV